MDAKTQGRAAHEPRVEDDVLVRGRGRYAADAPLPKQAYAYFVRSPHALSLIHISPWRRPAADKAAR